MYKYSVVSLKLQGGWRYSLGSIKTRCGWSFRPNLFRTAVSVPAKMSSPKSFPSSKQSLHRHVCHSRYCCERRGAVAFLREFEHLPSCWRNLSHRFDAWTQLGGGHGVRVPPTFSDNSTFFSLGFVIYWFHTKLSPHILEQNCAHDLM